MARCAYEGDPIPTIKRLDESGDTVLLRSFSKIAFPGLRVGWVIGAARPDREADRSQAVERSSHRSAFASRAAALRGIGTPGASIGSKHAGSWAASVCGPRSSACERHLPDGVSFTRPRGGMSLWVTLPAPLDAGELAAARRTRRRHLSCRAGILRCRVRSRIVCASVLPG